jgi:hypothetical protein
MPKDIKKIYIVCVSTFAILLAAVFLDNVVGKILPACVLLALAVLASVMLKKRVSPSPAKREVILISSIIGVIFVVEAV